MKVEYSVHPMGYHLTSEELPRHSFCYNQSIYRTEKDLKTHVDEVLLETSLGESITYQQTEQNRSACP